ncbi:reverse transcriptase domain-containing protein [Tanacetum coccineum]
MAEDSPAHTRVAEQEETLTEEKMQNVQRTMEGQVPTASRYETNLWKLYTDGVSNDHGPEAGIAGWSKDSSARGENKKVDALSKLAAAQCEGLTKGVLVEELNERSVDMAEVNTIVEEAARTWMTPIQEYIERGILSDDTTESRTIREKAHNYVIKDGILYRKSYLGPLLRCIGPQQAKYVIKEIHTRSCGMHDEPRKAYKAMNAGYYWLSMHRDANNKITSCDSCQGIKKRLLQEEVAWIEELPNVLWAHRTTPKTINREIPFSLAYSTKAVIHAKIGMPTRRIIQGLDEENEEALWLNLNLLQER